MRYLISIFFVAMMVSKGNAQHCPLDGMQLIAIQLTDKNGNAVQLTKDSCYLTEIENNNPAECTYANEKIKKPLMNNTSFEAWCTAAYSPTYSQAIIKRLEGIKVLNNTTYIITLNQAERTCMIKKDNDFAYTKRKFAITFFDGTKEINSPVPPEAIQSLCTASDLAAFKPIEIKL
jgi:hypothetical protein